MQIDEWMVEPGQLESGSLNTGHGHVQLHAPSPDSEATAFASMVFPVPEHSTKEGTVRLNI